MALFDVARIGTHVSIGTHKKTLGSLGVVVTLPDGRFAAVTAGHVVRMARGADLVAKTGTTTMLLGKPIVTLYDDVDDADIALVGPLDGDITSVSGELVFVRNPTLSDINTQVEVYRVDRFTPAPAWVHGVDVPASFFRADGPGQITLEGLVAIDAVADPGDSGGPVMDDRANLIGFVVGGDGLRTYLMPAERGLDALAGKLS